MDFGDFLNATGAEGTKWMRIVTGIIGAIVGGAIGALYGAAIVKTTLASVLYGALGVLLGGGLGALFSGFIFFALIVVVCIAASVAWQFLVKGA